MPLFSRENTNRVRWVIDRLLPPVIGDSRWLNLMLVRIMYGKGRFDLDSKEKGPFLTDAEFRAAYEATSRGARTRRSSDTTAGQADFVLENLIGESALEVGCGGGLLAARMAATGRLVVACDIKNVLEESVAAALARRQVGLSVVLASVHRLPMADRSVDTVVTTHTLEHVRDLRACVAEIVRVARRRVVIVVPCQAYKRYTIDYHLHFFPTETSLKAALGLPDAVCRRVDRDWCLMWDRKDLDAAHADAWSRETAGIPRRDLNSYPQ